MKLFTHCLLFIMFGLSGIASADSELHYNQIRFQVSATDAVANDRMQAVLVAQDEDGDPARLADRINQTMAWALDQARGHKDIRVRSGGYTTQPVYTKERIGAWRASQELILDSADFAKLGQMIGSLQQRMQLRSVSFSVSTERREQVVRALIDTALESFKQRANQVRTNIGAKAYRIVELNISTEDPPMQPMVMMHAEAMDKSVATPRFEGGDSDVRVSVHGVVQLD